MDRSGSVKVHFRLTVDADGYPPIAVESVWAQPGSKIREFVLDNVPFFASEATLGDTVLVRDDDDGHHWFEAVLQRSRNSLVRVVFFDRAHAAGVSAHLEGLGCATEHFIEHNLLAVSIPETVRATDVQDYLEAEAGRGILDYEEPILRQ